MIVITATTVATTTDRPIGPPMRSTTILAVRGLLARRPHTPGATGSVQRASLVQVAQHLQVDADALDALIPSPTCALARVGNRIVSTPQHEGARPCDPAWARASAELLEAHGAVTLHQITELTDVPQTTLRALLARPGDPRLAAGTDPETGARALALVAA